MPAAIHRTEYIQINECWFPVNISQRHRVLLSERDNDQVEDFLKVAAVESGDCIAKERPLR